MQCPTDGTVLVMSERSGIEIDYCPTCRGVWLDRGELDKIIERSEQRRRRRLAPTPTSRSATSAGRTTTGATPARPLRGAPAAQAQGELAQRAVRLTRPQAATSAATVRAAAPSAWPSGRARAADAVLVAPAEVDGHVRLRRGERGDGLAHRGDVVGGGDAEDDRRGMVTGDRDHPALGWQVPADVDDVEPARRSAVAKASTPSSCREPRARPTITRGAPVGTAVASRRVAIRRCTVALTKCSPATVTAPRCQAAPRRCRAGISQPSTTSSNDAASRTTRRARRSSAAPSKSSASAGQRVRVPEGRRAFRAAARRPGPARRPWWSRTCTRAAASRGDQPAATRAFIAHSRRDRLVVVAPGSRTALRAGLDHVVAPLPHPQRRRRDARQGRGVLDGVHAPSLRQT